MTDFLLILQRASLFGLAALAIALVLQWILADRVPASWRVWVWRVALIQTALALVPFAPVALSVLPARAPVAAPVIEAPITEAPHAQAPSVPPVSAPTTEAPLAAEKAPSIEAMPSLALEEPVPAPQTNSVATRFSWRELALAIYALGIALQLLLLLRNAVRVRRVLRACTPLDDARLSVIAARLNIAKTPRLLQSAGGAPFLVGIFRPTIVLPATLDETHLEAVLTHELAHLRRRDLAWNLLLWALQTLLWFHPLAFVSRRFHALEVESACDELTLQLTPIAPKSYGALLISAENSQASPLAAGVGDNFFALQTRLKRLGRAPIQPRRRAAWLLGAALLFSFVAVVPFRLTARAQGAKETGEPIIESVTGVVVNPSGAVLPGAIISIEGLDVPGDIGPRGTVRADANGRFVVPAALVKRPAQLFANWNERSSLHGALVQNGDEVTLVLNSDVLATIRGRTTEAGTQKFLPDVAVELYRSIDGGEVPVASVQSDARGWFKFSGLRPFRNYFMRFKSANHYRVGEIVNVQHLSRAMTSQFGVVMEATNSKLRGRLLEPDGSPAAGYGIRVSDGLGPISGRPEVLTRSDGKFFFGNVTKSGVFLVIREPNAKTARFAKRVPTGDPNLIPVRLNDKLRLADNASKGGPSRKAANPNFDSSALVGQIAPALRVRPEGDPPSLSSLRGKIVLLCFKPYDALSPVVGNFALSYQKRNVRVVCVQNVRIIAKGIEISDNGKVTYKGLFSPEKAIKEELGQIKWAKEYDDLPIDVALDLPRSTDPNAENFGGQSAALYQGAEYVVIGRDGAITYAGNEADRAIETVTASVN